MKNIPQHLNKILGAACAVILSAASSQAVDWTGATGTYNNAANWSTLAVPGAGDNTFVNNGGTVLINPGDPNWTVIDLMFGNNNGTSGFGIQDGPNVTVNGWFRIGSADAASSGAYNLKAGTLNNPSSRFTVGENGTATFIQTNTGVMTTTGELWLGQGGTGNGTYNLDGTSQVTVNNWVAIGRGGGTGKLNMSGNTTFTKGGGGNFIIGDNATGTVNHSGGTISINNELWLGQAGGGRGTNNMSGTAAMTVNNWLAIGRDSATGELNLSGNASVTKTGGGNMAFAGIGGAALGIINQTGGAVTNETSETWLGENGTGIWNMSSGYASLALLRYGPAGGNGTFNLNGGTLAVNQINQGSGSGTLNLNGGTLRARTSNTTFFNGLTSANVLAGGVVLDSQAFNVTIAQALLNGGAGGLTKTGSGKAILTGANTYAGNTVVNAGKLVEGTASLVTSDVTVANTAGFGVIVGVLNGQVNHPNVTLSGAANSLDFDLAAFGNPTLAPLNVTATLNVNGTTTVNIADAFPQVGQFPLVKYVTKTGAGVFVIGTLPVGVSATLSNNVGNSSIDLVITSTALIRWSGQVAGGVWDINTTTNWTDYVTLLSAKYTEGAAIYFDDLALGTTTMNLGVTVNPGAVIITNDTLAYTLNGVGAINGAVGLNKSGSNSFTIANVNSYTGPTVISGGTLSISSLPNGGSPSAIGSSSASASSLVLSGGKLSYTGPSAVTDRGYTVAAGNSSLQVANDVTFNGAVSSSVNGNFAKTGNGKLSHKRTGANTLSSGGGLGAYDIINGTVIMDGSAGAQVNTVTGEFATGTTTNSTGGTLILTNTTLNVSSWFSIARGSSFTGATSSVALYNSNLRSQNAAMGFNADLLGIVQTGLLTLNDTSTYTNTGDSNLGESAGGTAIITLKDSSILHANNRMQLGWHNSATGHMVIANSAKVVVNAWMSIGNEGGVGSVIVKDSGTLALSVQGDLNVTDVNTGTADLTVQDSGTVVANALFVGKGNGATGTYNQNGGTSQGRNGGGLYVEVGSQPFSTGTLNLNAGTFKARWIRNVNAGASYINFNGAQIVVARDGGDGVNADFLSTLTAANVLAGGANIDTGTNSISIGQALLDGGGAGGLTKSGTGTLSLNGANTYTGTTLVSAGTLGGNGSIAGNVTVQAAGTITAGDATGVGQLTISGNLAIQGNIAADIATSVSPSNDVIVVTGTRSRTGTGAVTIRNLGPVPQVGQKFFLFNGAVTGAGTMAVTGGGATWQNDLAADGSITVLTVIPAPTFSPGSVATLLDGNKSVTATGTIGSAYRLWASSDVTLTPITTTWTLLTSGTVTASPFTINDLTATNFTKRFYIFSNP